MQCQDDIANFFQSFLQSVMTSDDLTAIVTIFFFVYGAKNHPLASGVNSYGARGAVDPPPTF